MKNLLENMSSGTAIFIGALIGLVCGIFYKAVKKDKTPPTPPAQ